MKSSRQGVMLACCALLGLTAYLVFPLLACIDRCFVDLGAVHGQQLGSFEFPDTRLNAWTLAWVQHALLSQPLELFSANVFYPAPNSLAGSEHMIGLALLTLPLRLVTTNAILLHQLTLVLSSVILVGSTFALVRWLSGSVVLAFFSGGIALFMPWRVAELTHVQLLGAHWFPLIWLLVLRILIGEGRRWDAALLALVLSLQLLSSYYLAYMLTFSLALLLPIAGLWVGLKRRSVYRLSLALAAPFALLFLTSIPYLNRESRGELFILPDLEIPTGIDVLANVWAFIAPRFETAWSQAAVTPYAHAIPVVIGICALLTLVPHLPAGHHEDGGNRRLQMVTVWMWLCVLGALLMMLGPQIRIGASLVKLPGYWASQWVPGFSNLRAPQRWGIILGTVFPVLAAMGIGRVDRRLSKQAGIRWQRVFRLSIALLLFINLPWRQLPARQAWEHPGRVRAACEALRALPYGPIVEVPWGLTPLVYSDLDAQYMLASTQHWRPLLSGYTGHFPPTFRLLRRAAQRLPENDAVEVLGRLTDVRWVVVHLDQLTEAQKRVWREADRVGNLRHRYADDHTLIYEFPQHSETGVWMSQLASPEVRPRTLSGLPRTPLQLSEESGQLQAYLEGGFHFLGMTAFPHPVALTVANSSGLSWPGLDYQTEGLVALRYIFSQEDDRIIKSAAAPLDTDIPSGSATRAFPLLTPPTLQGEYRLCLDLVQKIEGGLVPLPIRPVELRVRVAGSGEQDGGLLGDLAAVYKGEVVRSGRDAVSPCAARRGQTTGGSAATE